MAAQASALLMVNSFAASAVTRSLRLVRTRMPFGQHWTEVLLLLLLATLQICTNWSIGTEVISSPESSTS